MGQQSTANDAKHRGMQAGLENSEAHEGQRSVQT